MLSCLHVDRAHAALEPFVADDNTVLLYHFDEGDGDAVLDASGHGHDGILQGARRVGGRFGRGLWFDGNDDSVFLARPDAVRGLRRLTVECWFRQEQTSGRRFLIGHDVCFHFEVDDAGAVSISLYNQGGRVPNAEGKPHQQVAMGGVSVRPGRWHHLAITYDGRTVGYFLDGTLRGRRDGPSDFSLGADSRGLWLGCYVGTDFWYSGLIDEVRVSDCVRYDPEGTLSTGDVLFEMPAAGRPLRPPPAVRKPLSKDKAQLSLEFRKGHGGPARGWVCLRPPGRPAVVVGQYTVDGAADTASRLELDVSDEDAGTGTYLVGLVPESFGYFSLTAARLTTQDRPPAEWSGSAPSRSTFRPPVLVALTGGTAAHAVSPAARLLRPDDVDRAEGALVLEQVDEAQPPVTAGDGMAEWWLHEDSKTTYRVFMRYAAACRMPCDIVIDGRDLNRFDMCALNATGSASPRDAFWEYQGHVTLEPGPHWMRLQDVLPDTVALLLQPTTADAPGPVPWGRFPVPDADALTSRRTEWAATPVLGRPSRREPTGRQDETGALLFAADFANTDPGDALAADILRFSLPVRWDLEPAGRLSFTLHGNAGEHVVAVGATDAKGDEKLLWRCRDVTEDPVEVKVPLQFEGNDVFDPGRVVALWIDLDEGNHLPERHNTMQVRLHNARFTFRADLAGSERPDHARDGAPARAPDGQVPGGTDGPVLRAPPFRPWTRPVIPEEHPRYAATRPVPVTRGTMGYSLHFTGARGVSKAVLADYHDHHDFGDVCWPHIGILPQRRNYPDAARYQHALEQLEERVTEVRDRGLYLFDIWGYVPHGEAGPTPKVAPEHHEILTRVLGERFTGYDNGEQDGRYIGAYAGRDPHTNRREGWEAFVRWDQGICADSMNYMNATGSLNFSHYYGERGARLLGLETAQGLPSDTLMFAFLRGASKEYGRLTYQATSIWNRFGYNMYHDRRTTAGGGYGLGPNKGCSLSLHRRLFFQSYTGGDVIVGTETAQFTGDRLANGAPEPSPLGRQHLRIRTWADAHPRRGVMFTPVAVMLDFHHGWNMPRHLYRPDRYKIWGKLPYEKGDYAIDALFRMVWPGYQDASYLRNERGFITPTPYGDILDVITNRCPADVLRQYAAIVLMGEVEITDRLRAGLGAFVRAGGDLLVGPANAVDLPIELTGIDVGDSAQAGTTVCRHTGQAWPEQPYTRTTVGLRTAVPLLVDETGNAVMTLNRAGAGRVVVCAVEHWLTDRLTYADPSLVDMEPPYRMPDGVRAVLHSYLASFCPFSVDPPGLNLRLNCFDDDPNRWLIGLTNNDLFADWSGRITLRSRTALSARDLWRERVLPVDGGIELTVAKGDVAMVEVLLAPREP